MTEKYIVIELQTDSGGNVANIVTAKESRREAESTYHSVLTAAALSGLPAHAAVLLTNKGQLIKTQCYGESEQGWEES